jgi:hypothetical protein
MAMRLCVTSLECKVFSFPRDFCLIPPSVIRQVSVTRPIHQVPARITARVPGPLTGAGPLPPPGLSGSMGHGPYHHVPFGHIIWLLSPISHASPIAHRPPGGPQPTRPRGKAQSHSGATGGVRGAPRCLRKSEDRRYRRQRAYVLRNTQCAIRNIYNNALVF